MNIHFNFSDHLIHFIEKQSVPKKQSEMERLCRDLDTTDEDNVEGRNSVQRPLKLEESTAQDGKGPATFWQSAWKEVSSRVASFVLGFTFAIARTTYHLTRSVQLFVGGIISFKSDDFKKSAACLLLALIQGIGLPIIGILGVANPQIAISVGKLPPFFATYDKEQKYPEVIAMFMGVINGITFAPCRAVTGVMRVIASPFTIEPVEFAREGGKDLAKVIGDISCGVAGIFHSKPRENVLVQTV